LILGRFLIASPAESQRQALKCHHQLMMSQNTISPAAASTAYSRWLRWIVVALIAGTLSLVLLFPFPQTGRQWSELFNLAHAPSFFITFLLAAGLLDPSSVGFRDSWPRIARMSLRRLIVLASILLVLGGICEVLQQFVGRATSLSDMLANGCGLLAGLCWCVGRLVNSRSKKSIALVTTAALLLMPSWSPGCELRECVLQRNEFPLLASFERPRELNAWYPHEATIKQSAEWTSIGSTSMRVNGLAGTKHPGANFQGLISDWHQFTALELDAFNLGDKPLTLRFSIFDEQHHASGHAPADRFGGTAELPAGKVTHIRIELADVKNAPAERVMDMSRIESLNLFVVRPDADFAFLVDNVRLTGEAPK